MRNHMKERIERQLKFSELKMETPYLTDPEKIMLRNRIRKLKQVLEGSNS